MDGTGNVGGTPRSPAAPRSRKALGRCSAAVWRLLSRLWFLVFCAAVTALWAWSFFLADGVGTGWPVLGSLLATVSVLPGTLLLFLQLRSERERRGGSAGAVLVSLAELLAAAERRAAARLGCPRGLRPASTAAVAQCPCHRAAGRGLLRARSKDPPPRQPGLLSGIRLRPQSAVGDAHRSRLPGGGRHRSSGPWWRGAVDRRAAAARGSR